MTNREIGMQLFLSHRTVGSSSRTGPSALQGVTGQTAGGCPRVVPDVLPYLVGTPTTFGFAGRNGRTLADNAPEVMLSRHQRRRAVGPQAGRCQRAAQRHIPLRDPGVTTHQP
jgi:hypothetical protein